MEMKGRCATGPVHGVHMRGAAEIADIFGVNVKTVREWRKAGAPIFMVGKKWQASYFDLWNWIKNTLVEERKTV